MKTIKTKTPITLGFLLLFSGPWATTYLRNLTGEAMPSAFTGFGISLTGVLILLAVWLDWLFNKDR